MTDANGRFSLAIADDESYLLQLSYMGYDALCASLQANGTPIDLRMIQLYPLMHELKGVTVTANNRIQRIDRQLILPSKVQIAASNDGLTLLQNLQLSRIKTITTALGEAVQLRINGSVAAMEEVLDYLGSHL